MAETKMGRFLRSDAGIPPRAEQRRRIGKLTMHAQAISLIFARSETWFHEDAGGAGLLPRGEASRRRPDFISRMIMASTFVLPDGFSWLAESCRPTAQEVETYTQFLAAEEGTTLRSVETLRREAELQLWIWRAENQPPAPRRRHPPRQRRLKTG